MGDPWHAERSPWPSASLPARADVAVIGAGPAGLCLAVLLAEAGVNVAVLEAHTALGSGAFGRGTGTALGWLLDHPHRLLASLGDTEGRRFLAFVDRSLALARDLLEPSDGWHPDGALVVPGWEEEIPEVQAGLEASGLAATLTRTVQQVRDQQGLSIIGDARFVPGGARFHPVRALTALGRRATCAGATIVPGCEVSEIDASGGAPSLRTSRGTLRAELVVIAGGTGSLGLDPLSSSFALPLWQHALEVALPAAPAPEQLVLAGGHGQIRVRSMPDGHWLVGGLRTESATLGGPSRASLRRLMLAFVGSLAGTPAPGERQIVRAWAAPCAHTRDVLPLVGPVPGKVRVLLCTGFNGHDAELAFGAARAVSQGILHGRAEAVPRCLDPRRCLP